MPYGKGRSFPGSSPSENGFLREDSAATDGLEFVTAAEVQQALREIDAVAESEAGITATGLIQVITQDTVAKFGGTYLAKSSCKVTLPAFNGATIANAANRRITTIPAGAAVTITHVVAGNNGMASVGAIASASGALAAAVTVQNTTPRTYDLAFGSNFGSDWYPVN